MKNGELNEDCIIAGGDVPVRSGLRHRALGRFPGAWSHWGNRRKVPKVSAASQRRPDGWPCKTVFLGRGGMIQWTLLDNYNCAIEGATGKEPTKTLAAAAAKKKRDEIKAEMMRQS